MIQLNPLTKEEARRRSANSLRGTVNALKMRVESMKPNRVDVTRIGELLLKLKQRFVPTYDDAERLEGKIKEAMDDRELFTVNLEGDRLFVSGYIKVNKLGKTAIW